MKRGIGVFVLGIAVFVLLGGCAAQRVADGDHVAPYTGGGVYYEFHNADTGAGKTPLVLVHGWACDHQYWDAQIAGLGGDRAVLAMDLPGCGKTDDGGAEHTMGLYAEAVIAAMNDAGIDRAVLVGHSMGTPVIRQVYRHHPDRVAGLVGVDGALRLMGTSEQMMAMGAPLFTDEWQAYITRMFDGMSSAMVNDDDRAHVRRVMLATSIEGVRGGFSAMYDPSIWTDDAIDAPLLLVLADAPFWTEEYRDYVRRLAPGAQIVVLEGVSHFLMMDDPERFNGTVENWLEKNGL